MAFSTEADAGHRITSITHGGTELKKAFGCTIEKIIERESRMAGSAITPISRPVSLVDARASVRFMDLGGGIAETASAGNIVANFSSQSGSGSVTVGTMLAGSQTIVMEKNSGGFSLEQVFEFQGSSLTWTISI